MARMKGWKCAVAALAIVAGSGTALAEAVTMTGYFAADAREVSQLPRLAVDRFSGTDGGAFADSVERAIANQSVDGRPYYRLVADPGAVDRILKDGADRAAALAEPILDEVYRIVGFLKL